MYKIFILIKNKFNKNSASYLLDDIFYEIIFKTFYLVKLKRFTCTSQLNVLSK